MTMIRCNNASLVPMTPHWAVIRFERIYSDDDYCEDYQKYLAFTDELSWKEYITDLVHTRPHEKFVAMKVSPATLSVQVNVDVNLSF